MLRLIVTAVENINCTTACESSVKGWISVPTETQIGTRATPAVDTCEDTRGLLHFLYVFLADLASLHGERDAVAGEAINNRVGSAPSACLRRLVFQSRPKDRI